MSNEELVLRIQAGEQDLLAVLWIQVEKFITREANRRFISTSGFGGVEPDDLVQSGFLALVQAVRYFDPDKDIRFITYLSGCLKTAFSEAGGYRGDKQSNDPLHRSTSLDVPAQTDDPDGETLLDLQPAPGDAFEDVEYNIYIEQLHEALVRAMDDLPTDQRDTLVRRFWFGESSNTIAEATGVTISVARTRESNALRTLRRKAYSNGLDQFIERQTPYYLHVGVDSFNRTGTSAVEAIAIYRENLAEHAAVIPPNR